MIYPNWTTSTSSTSLPTIDGSEHTFDFTNVDNHNGMLVLQLDHHPPRDTPTIGYRLNINNFTVDGEIVNTFVSVATDDGYANPTLTALEDGTYTLTVTTADTPTFSIINDGTEARIDTAYSLFLLGTLTCSYLPAPRRVHFDTAIECSTVIADNSLTLRSTPVPLFSRPVTVGEDDTTWWMSWGYAVDSPEFASLLEGQPFILSDRIFGLTYHLYKNGGGWTGSNCCIHINGTVKATRSGGSQYYYFGIERSDINIAVATLLKLDTTNLAKAMHPYLHIAREDGTVPKMSSGWDWGNENGQDYGRAVFNDSRFHKGDVLILTITVGNMTLATLKAVCDVAIGGGLIYPDYESDTVVTFELTNASTIEPITELKLFMLKAFTIADDTNLWDGKVNPWSYINNVDGYNITPDPSASQALVSPYSIISNGVMLAENLESHTYRINDIGNDVTLINSQIASMSATLQQLAFTVSEITATTDHMNFESEISAIEMLVQLICQGGKMILGSNGIRNAPTLHFDGGTAEVNAIATTSTPTVSDTHIATSAYVKASIEARIEASIDSVTPVTFPTTLVAGNWNDINNYIKNNITKNRIMVFQTSYASLKPMCVIVFPSIINHNNQLRGQSSAIAFPANHDETTFYVALITMNGETVTSISWSSTPLTPVDGSTSTWT